MPTPNRKSLVQGSILSAGVLLVVALVGILNYFGMKYYHRFDWTAERIYSLSDKTIAVLNGLDKDIEVTMFLPAQSPLHDQARELLERYAAKSKRLTFRVVEAEKNLIEAQRLVDKYQISSLNVVVFDSGTDRRVVEEGDLADYDYSGLQFGGAPEMTGFKGEEAFSGAILALVESHKPKVRFTSGHGELALEDVGGQGLSRIRELLGRENLDLESWSSLGQAEVPAGTDLLVIAGPRSGFIPPELEAFARYLEAGGRMMVLLDPELARAGGLVATGLESWLARYGVKVGDDIVVDPSAVLPFFGAETIFANATGASKIVQSLQQAKYPVIVALARSVAAGATPAGMEAQVLLETSAEGWGETDLADLKAVAKGERDRPGPVPLAVAVAAKPAPPATPDLAAEELAPETPPTAPVSAAPAWRLVVVGDSDFATNGQLANAGNPTLLANAFNWLLERQKLIEIGPKRPEQVHLTLTPAELSAITWGVLAGLPLLAVVAGVTVYLRRRR